MGPDLGRMRGWKEVGGGGSAKNHQKNAKKRTDSSKRRKVRENWVVEDRSLLGVFHMGVGMGVGEMVGFLLCLFWGLKGSLCSILVNQTEKEGSSGPQRTKGYQARHHARIPRAKGCNVPPSFPLCIFLLLCASGTRMHAHAFSARVMMQVALFCCVTQACRCHPCTYRMRCLDDSVSQTRSAAMPAGGCPSQALGPPNGLDTSRTSLYAADSS